MNDRPILLPSWRQWQQQQPEREREKRQKRSSPSGTAAFFGSTMFFFFLSFFLSSFFLLLSFAFIRFKLLCCALLLPLLVFSLWLFFYKWSPPPQAKGHWKRAKAEIYFWDREMRKKRKLDLLYVVSFGPPPPLYNPAPPSLPTRTNTHNYATDQ